MEWLWIAVAVLLIVFIIWWLFARESYQHFDSSRMRWWSWWHLPYCGDAKCNICEYIPPPYPKGFLRRT